MDLMNATFAVTDLETTGRSSVKNRITEVAVVSLRDGKSISEESSLVNPGQYISREIQELTGISNGMVLDAPSGGELFPVVEEWIAHADAFVAHNATFDASFLRDSFRREGIEPLTLPVLCTLRLARRLLPTHRGFSLGKLAGYLGVRVRSRHRALGDARATAKILASLIEIAREVHDIATLDELLALQYRPTGQFRPVNNALSGLAQQAKELPSAPGVYQFFGRGKRLLYVGKAVNLRSRVSSYFQPAGGHTRKNVEMVGRVRTIEFEETRSELSALLLEARLIKSLQPKYNVAGKRTRRYAFIRLDRSSPWARPEMVIRADPDGADYFGPFRSRDEAGMLIEALQRLFPLRECEGEIIPDRANVPCIYHGIGRCTAPCADLESVQGYEAILDQMVAILNGSEEGIGELIRTKMREASERLDFELAAELRDRLAEVERVFVWKQTLAESVNGNNLIVLVADKKNGMVHVYVVLHGRMAFESTISSRFPEKRLHAIVQRSLKQLDGRFELTDPLEIDEVRLVAGYLRRKAEGRAIVRIHRDSKPMEIVEQVRRATNALRTTT